MGKNRCFKAILYIIFLLIFLLFFAVCTCASDNVETEVKFEVIDGTNLEIDVTAPGFRPDMLFCGGPSEMFDASVNQDYRCSYGVAVNGGNQYGQFFDYPSNTGSGTAKGWTFSNRVAADRNNYTVEVDNFDADGFSLFH